MWGIVIVMSNTDAQNTFQDMALREKAGYPVSQAVLDFALGRPTAAAQSITSAIQSAARPHKVDEAARARVLAKRAARLEA